MKNVLFALAIALVGFTSCDKVENYLPADFGGDWDALYPNGDSADYAANEWPTFSENTNTDRNVLIEDFTGHRCIYCPIAADTAHYFVGANPGRVVVSSIHTGPTGQMEGFQMPIAAPSIFSTDFTNLEGFIIGKKFGVDLPGSTFVGNPYGAVSRIDHGNGFPVLLPLDWSGAVNSVLTSNDLKVNIQAEKNYYPSTRGLFLHAEVELLDPSIPNELKLVVHLIEDSLVAAQLYPGGVTDSFYVHRDIFRGSIDGFTFGRTLDAAHLNANGKYYFNYAYQLPAQYNADNMHVILYVRDAVTEEVYQVIKQHL